MRVVLSPHLDDAVLSAWSLLADGDALVVNVFDGVPPNGSPLTLWDRLCGATSSTEQALQRLTEDAAVLASLGVEHVSCGLLDALNRPEPISSEEVARYLRPFVAGADVYAPLAGGPKPHLDHRLVRDAARRLWAEGRLERLTVYGDIPYCVKGGGWPVSMGGTQPDPTWLRRIPREIPLGSLELAKVDLVVLGDVDRERKLSAMRGYATQYVNLDRKLRVKGLVSDPAVYGLEPRWRLP